MSQLLNIDRSQERQLEREDVTRHLTSVEPEVWNQVEEVSPFDG